MINVFKIEMWAWLEGGGGVAEWIKADLRVLVQRVSVYSGVCGA